MHLAYMILYICVCICLYIHIYSNMRVYVYRYSRYSNLPRSSDRSHPWGHPVKGADIAGLTGHFAFAVMRGTPKIWDLIAVPLGSREIQR